MIKTISGQIKARAGFMDPDRYGRSDTSAIGRWFWEIDKVLLLLVSVLIAIGLIAVAAASPAAAHRYSGGNVRFAELYYFWRQLAWIMIGIPVMIGISMMPREQARRLSLFGAAFFFALLVFVPIVGPEVNGARRWVNFGFGQVQPSEFLKPFFVVAMAWLLSLKDTDKSLPIFSISAVVTGGVAYLLMKQPDFGSTIIFCAVWVAMLALAGVNMRILIGLAVAGIVGVVLAYFFYDVATIRIDEFLFGTGDTFQTDNAMRTLTAGGLFGMGPGGGTRKFGLPEPHTDYIFSVIGEEFGLVMCAAVVLLYLAIIARVLVRLSSEEDLFTVLSATGLISLIGGQAFVNILVNLQLFPSKGMTLPLVSYGGSSTIAQCLTIGLLLALTRRNPFLSREGLGLVGALDRREKPR